MRVMMSTAPEYPALVSARLRALMAFQRKTTGDLAALLGVGQRAARRRMTGAAAISLEELPVIADWLGVSLSDLARDEAGIELGVPVKVPLGVVS
jgi:transcriptional regulator with XRE-family HTH domain